MNAVLDRARAHALDQGIGINQADIQAILELPEQEVAQALDLAHQVRLRWCGDMVEVEGIISLKTGGCPEDCHFCSQSGLFESPVRAVRLDIDELVEAAKHTAKTGATEFCIVAAVKGPNEALMRQVIEAIGVIEREVDINVSVSIGILTQEQADRLKEAGAHRYNHNIETARSFFPQVVTTHAWEDRVATLERVRRAGMEVCCGGIIGMGETIAQRAEFVAQLAQLAPEEVPLNFLDPRPGTPFAHRPVIQPPEALRAIAAARLAMPRAVIRYAGGRELALGPEGAEKGLLGGINALIVGNYLTTLGRPMETDIDMLGRLHLPIQALSKVV